MPLHLDIFRAEPDGVRWLESAADLDAAKERVQTLGPGEYVIFDYETQSRLSVTVPEKKSPKRNSDLRRERDNFPPPSQ